VIMACLNSGLGLSRIANLWSAAVRNAALSGSWFHQGALSAKAARHSARQVLQSTFLGFPSIIQIFSSQTESGVANR